MLEALTRFCRHLLQRHALVPDDDAFLRVAFHIDDGIDMDMVVILFETFHDDLYRVRDLLVVIAEDLLTDNLRDEELSRLVRQLVLVEVSRTLREQFFDPLR